MHRCSERSIPVMQYIHAVFVIFPNLPLVSWYLFALLRNQLIARCADSFMTSPSWPVKVSCPSPSIRLASTNMISPPSGVQARPMATPGWLKRSDTWKNHRKQCKKQLQQNYSKTSLIVAFKTTVLSITERLGLNLFFLNTAVILPTRER